MSIGICSDTLFDFYTQKLLYTRCCVINAKWQVKVADYWLHALNPETSACNYDKLPSEELEELLWTAPEASSGKK